MNYTNNRMNINTTHYKQKKMKRLFFLVVSVVLFIFGALTTSARTTVIISLDGFRWDYPHMYHTPFFDRLAQEGIEAEMMPSFPSKTFPNHYTLATGLYPDHHGLIDNRFYDQKSGLIYSIGDVKTKSDPRFYGGEPIWITARKQGKKTGVVYWPGSDVAIQGQYPDYYQNYDKAPHLTFAERIAEVERLLKLPEDKRPQLVMAYFEEPDHSGHSYGPTAPETHKAVEQMDVLLEQLYNDIRALPYGKDINFIVTADHGMATTSPERLIHLSSYLKKEWTTRIMTSLPTLIYPAKGCTEKIMKALQQVPHLRVWKKEDVPSFLHYGSNANIAAIVALPDVGWIIKEGNDVIPGNHGYDPESSDMHVMFRAAGPDFKKGYHMTHTFSNVNIYSLLAKLIGITPAPNDGNVDNVKELLAE